MRSTAFDMIGMTLMALVVILTCGVMFVWGYLRATRGRGDDPSSGIAQAGTGSSRATRAVSPTGGVADARDRRSTEEQHPA